MRFANRDIHGQDARIGCKRGLNGHLCSAFNHLTLRLYQGQPHRINHGNIVHRVGQLVTGPCRREVAGQLHLQKEFLRIDGDEEDNLISTLILTAQTLTEDVIRQKLSEFEEVPEPIHQAMLILVGTLYEERQISKEKSGVDIKETLDLVRRMLFAYRRTMF